MDTTAAENRAVRILLRFAIVAIAVGLLSGIAYQESAKKLTYADAAPGMRVESVLPLSLVHGHVLTLGALLPLALAGAIHLARKAGGAPLGERALRWSLRLWLPLTAAALALQLLKGYHFLLAARRGERDLAAISEGFLGGHGPFRYGIYAVVHTGMAVGLAVLLVALWRSLGRGRADADAA